MINVTDLPCVRALLEGETASSRKDKAALQDAQRRPADAPIPAYPSKTLVLQGGQYRAAYQDQ